MMTKLLTFKLWSALLFFTAIVATEMFDKFINLRILVLMQAALLILLFVLLVYMITDRVLFKKNISSFELLILILCIIPIHVGIAAQLEFGQPWFYGFLSIREFYYMLCGLPVYYALLWKKISLQGVEVAFLQASWFTLMLVCILYLFSPPGIVDVGHSEVKGEFLNTSTKLFVFGVIYYFIKLCNNLKFNDVISFLAFFFYLVFIRKGRGIILTTSLACLIFFIQYTTLPKKIVYFAMAIAIGLSALLFILIISPDFFDFFIKMYSDAFTVVLYGMQTEDSSANIRLIEASIAMDGISRNPWFGSGQLSLHWQGSNLQILGRFYPGDVGMLGVIYVTGILGTILVYSQFFYAYYISRYINSGLGSQQFILASKFTLLAFFLQSFTTAHALYLPGSNMIFVAVLGYIYRRYPRVWHSPSPLYISLSH